VSPRLFVISGPSGVGKGTLISRARDLVDDLEVAISATTRRPRPDEREGREYHFLSEREFARRVAAGEFLEHVRYAGNRYGTLRSEVVRRLADGKSVLLEIEVVGAREIKRRMPEAVLVFVAPPTFADLERRLRERGSDPPDAIADRIAIARGEMGAQPEFQETIVNDDVDQAARQLAELIRRATRIGEAS
jgi:guanylate kinase